MILRRLTLHRRVRNVLLIAGAIGTLLLIVATPIAQSEFVPLLLVAEAIAVALVAMLRYLRGPSMYFWAGAISALLTSAARLFAPTQDLVSNAFALITAAFWSIGIVNWIMTLRRAANTPTAWRAKESAKTDVLRWGLGLALMLGAAGVAESMAPHVVWGSGTLAQLWWLAEPGHSPLLWKAALLTDALVGAAVVYACALALGAPRLGAGLGALLWAIAPARLAPEALHLAPTFLLPLAFWCALKAATGRSTAWSVAAGACFAAALVSAPALAVAMAVVALAALAAVPRTHALLQSRQTLAWTLALPLIVAILGHSQILRALTNEGTMVGASVADTLRATGADGAYPWEFFMPSLLSGVFAPLVIAFFRATLHWGHVYSVAIAPGWSALLLSSLPWLLGRARGPSRTWRFAAVCVAFSLIVALPSHSYGVPLPSLTAALAVVSDKFAGGAQMALGATFAVVLLAAMGVGALRAAPATRTGLILGVACAVLVVLDAVPNFALLTRPDQSPISRAVAWGVRASPGSPIALYPFVGRDEPLAAELAYAVALAHGAALNLETDLPDRALLETALQTKARRALVHHGVRYVVLDSSAYETYATGTLGDQLALPPDLMMPAWRDLAPRSVDLSGVLYQTFSDDVVVIQTTR